MPFGGIISKKIIFHFRILSFSLKKKKDNMTTWHKYIATLKNEKKREKRKREKKKLIKQLLA